MKYNITIVVLCAIVCACNHSAIPSSTPVVNTEIKNQNGATILAGHGSVSILQTIPYKEWFDKQYNNYMVDSSTIKLLAPRLKHKTIEVFLGSWCGDSKREVPRLIKILQAAQFDTANLKLVFVDNSTKTYKQSPQHEEAGKLIHHVPTIIVYNGNNEMGRIIETPRISLEKDLLAIVLHKAYTPNYADIAWWVNNVKDRATPITNARLTGIATVIKPLCTHMSDFNAYGYVLMAQKNYIEAINVFRLNTLLFPAVAGTYDSLGEAYYTTGDNDKAKDNYNKVLQLKPGDENATKMLAQLK